MNNKYVRMFAALLAVMLVMSSTFAVAQTSRGTVTGTVVDPSGAVIPNATVTLTEKATNVSRETKSNDAGIYRFDAVTLGVYDISIQATGFRKSTVAAINVSANRIHEVGVTLQPGAAAETVLVEGAAFEALQTTEQLRGRNISATQLAELPIAGQNSLNLLTTLPGASRSNLGGSLDSGIGSINGARARANNFMIDGVENNDISVAGPAITLTNNDALQEVAIQTSNFSSEFGRGGGAVVNQITKSGTNQLHGTLAWVYLTQNFNATNRAQRIAATPGQPVKPPFKENIPAFTLGGPVMIPGLYNGKDKTFWFAAGQWDRYSDGGSTVNFTVPTAAGIATLNSLASACPQAQRYLAALGGLVATTQLSTIDLSIPANVFAATGSCNGTNRAGLTIGTGLATRLVPSVYTNDNHQVRVDHKINADQQFSARWNYTNTAQNNATVGLNSQYDADVTDRSMSIALTHTWVLSSTFTNEFRFNYGRINPQFPLADPTGPGSVQPTFSFTGLSGYGASSTFPQGRTANNWQYQDTMSKVVGRHTFRWGVDFLRQTARQSAPVNARGSLSYASSVNVTGCATCGIVSGFSNYLDDFSGPGTAPTSRQFGSPVYRPNLFRHSYFVQDSWKVTSAFTLNYGVRYENYGQPANIFTFPVVSLDPATFSTPSEVNQDNNNFAPSFGFAYNPRWNSGFLGALGGDGKMVIRGGYQMSYDSWFNNLLSNMAAGVPNNPSNVAVTNTIGAASPRGRAGLFATVFPTLAAAPLSPLQNGASQFTKNMRNPYTNRMSLGIQRELPLKLVADVSYVGSMSRKLFTSFELNPITPNATFTAAGSRLNPAMGARNVRHTGANANYNSLQAELRRPKMDTYIGALGFTMNYTWAKNMDIVTEAFATNSNAASLSSAQLFRLTTHGNVDYGPSDNDRRHRFVITSNWDIKAPTQGVLGQVLGGWTLGIIGSAQSGTPFSVLNGADRDFDGVSGADRPIIGNPNAPMNTRARVSSVCSTGFISQAGACVTPNDVRWVQVTTFRLPDGQTPRRNHAYTKGFRNVDMNIIKKFSITERWKFEYRAEVFNILNLENTNFVPTGVSIGSGAQAIGTSVPFLDYSQSNAGNRSMRMGVKVIF